jgi:hypothetical protein
MKIVYPTLKLSTVLLTACFLVIIFSCDDDEPKKVKEPAIISFTPTSALPGSEVIITGENFSTTAADNEVAFNGVAATVSSASATELTVAVPATASTGKITVTVNGKTATSSADFLVLQTTLTNFSPTSGSVGTEVIITGTNFSATPSENVVKFNGAAATVSAATSTQLTVTVPAEATTGKITVTVNGKTVTSANDFSITTPTITEFFPPIAATGISVKIKGTNFSSIAANNIVKFNGTSATVTAASATELTVTVPGGASTGTLTVKVGPNTATASGSFEICNGVELVISEVVLPNVGSTSYTVAFKITNVGTADVDLTKMGMQNYASADATYGGGDVAASGFGFSSAPTALAPGASYTTPNYSCNIVGGNTTSHPYLIITMSDAPDGSVPECNINNNIVVKAFN